LIFDNTKVREDSTLLNNKIDDTKLEIDEIKYKIMHAKDEANNLERDNKLIENEINNSVIKLT